MCGEAVEANRWGCQGSHHATQMPSHWHVIYSMMSSNNREVELLIVLGASSLLASATQSQLNRFRHTRAFLSHTTCTFTHVHAGNHCGRGASYVRTYRCGHSHAGSQQLGLGSWLVTTAVATAALQRSAARALVNATRVKQTPAAPQR